MFHVSSHFVRADVSVLRQYTVRVSQKLNGFTCITQQTGRNNTYYSGFMIAEVAPGDTTKQKIPEIES